MGNMFDFQEPSDTEVLSDAALLELCLAESENVSVTAVERRLRDCTEENLSRLRRLRERAERTVSKIRLPSGIFVGQQDRANAYRTACEALLFLEPLWAETADGLVALFGVETSLCNVRNAHLRLDALLLEYVDRKTAEQDCARKLKRELEEQGRRAETLSSAILNQREALQRLSETVSSDFASRISKIADMEHDGAYCDPVGALRLFAELRDAVGDTERLVGAYLKGEG